MTWAAIGNGKISAPALVIDQAEAQITAEPNTTDVNAINAANANINTAFHTGKTEWRRNGRRCPSADAA